MSAAKTKDRLVAWKYFTLFCDDGTKIAGVLAVNGPESEVWISVYGEETTAFDLRFPKVAHCSAPGQVSVRSNFIVTDDERIRLHISEGGVRLDVSAWSTVEWPDNTLVHKAGDEEVLWKVPFLRMDFVGTLQVGHKSRQIRGLMFQDEVSHELTPSLHLLRNFRGWTWGILYSETRSILFVHIDYVPKPLRLLCVAGPDGVVSTNRGIDPGDVMIETADYPAKRISISWPGERIDLELDRHHPVIHGSRAGKLLYRLWKPKYHSIGIFSFGDERGEAYVESLNYRKGLR